MEWGSDAVAAVIRELGFEYIALVPGSSFAGLHDSLVNYLHEDPPLLLCLHEEHAVGIAHGYARVTGKPMLAVVHSNVGLMHATMAFFSAWCDRMPAVVIGANGPLDAKKPASVDRLESTVPATPARWFARIPNGTDMPASVEAAVDSIVRATQHASTLPMGPAYVVLDMTDQDRALAAPVALPDKRRFAPPQWPGPTEDDLQRVLRVRTRGAAHHHGDRPLLARSCGVGRARRAGRGAKRYRHYGFQGWRVISNRSPAARRIAGGASHGGATPRRPLRRSHPQFGKRRSREVCSNAPSATPLSPAKIVNVSLDRYITNGWSFDHQATAAGGPRSRDRPRAARSRTARRADRTARVRA